MTTSSSAYYVLFKPLWWSSKSASTTCYLRLRTSKSMIERSSTFFLWSNLLNNRWNLSRRLSSKRSRMPESRMLNMLLGNGLFILWMIMLSCYFIWCLPSILFSTNRTSRRRWNFNTTLWKTAIQVQEINWLNRCKLLLISTLSFMISCSVKLSFNPVGTNRETIDLSCKELLVELNRLV